jgi:hypothetical protein
MSTQKPFWVEDIAEAWTWLSMWVQGLGMAAMGAFLALTEEQRSAVFEVFGLSPTTGVAATAALTFVAGMLARVKNQ